MTDPIDFAAEVAAFDREAEVGTWPGPRYRLTYRSLGQGTPLILIPGLASTYRAYAATLNRLAPRFRTIQLDYPGEHPDDGAELAAITHDDLAADLLGLSDHLSLDRPILFGLSFGSTVALRALARDPGRYASAVLQGGFARRRLGPAERLALKLGRRFRGNASRLPFHDLGLATKARATFAPGMDARWSHYVEQNGLTPIAALSHRLDLIGTLDLRPLLPEIPHPVLLIHGTADRIVPPRHLDELAALLPRGRPLRMPGVGHQPHYTHPEELADLITDFAGGVGR